MSESEPDILYHYTGETALISIISGKGAHSPTSSIWASDALFQNDSMELLEGRAPLRQALEYFIEERSADPKFRFDGTSTHNLRDAVKYFSDYLNEFENGPTRPHRVFVSCFCEDPDLLSQWRSYGQGGYSIGFDRRLLATSVPEGFEVPHDADFYSRPVPPRVRSVVYTTTGVRTALEDEVNEILGPSGGALRGWQSYGQLSVLLALARIKNLAFESEKEWRLIYVQRGGIIGWSNMSYKQSDFRPPAEARSGPNSVVPFIKMQFPKSAIRSIRVGPGGDKKLRLLAIERICEGLELDVEITSSEVPYRG